MKKNGRFLFVLGIAVIFGLALPSLVLGENAVFTYHDQLDGEMIAYILQARHLGDGQFLPEFLGGSWKTALTPPAPGCVLLFLSGHYLVALHIMQIVGRLVGYVGMYLLVRELTDSSVAALAAGGMYACLPFLPVYGLSQFGLPMLMWCVFQLRKGRWIKVSFCYGFLYALNSSLVLVGFGVLLTGALWLGCQVWRNKQQMLQQRLLFPMMLWMELLLVYLVTNLSLIGQMLGIGGGGTSHKAEYVLAADSFLRGWLEAFLYGGQHSADYHLSFLGLAVIDLLSLYLLGESGRLGKIIWGTLVCNLALAAVSAAWNSGVGVLIRSHMGALGAFQLDRLLWLCPCLWYLMLGCCVAAVLKLCGNREKKHRLAGGVCFALMAASLGITGWQILKDSDVKANLQKLRNTDYPVMSYSDYYAIGVMEQVKDFLWERTGLEQKDYRVVSLGIDPAAALYHGFYCLDGYSNNYSLEYKHSFRKVIAPALEESDYLRDYYDNWGNRCYLFGTECPGYYTIEKNGFYFQHLELDTEALRELGGNYLFSAAYIANSDELGLTLLREEPFETEESYYRIFLYEVEAP
jgi:hypothetical protein